MPTPLLEATSLHKTYRLGKVIAPVLHGVDVRIEPGEWLAILGASGSGKSTLMHLLGGLDRPDPGESGTDIRFNGHSLLSMSHAELDRYRNRSVGFVFQFYHLLPELTALENTMIGAMIRLGRLGFRASAGKQRARATKLLDAFELGDRLRHRPVELSGGERQRVAIARALMNDPAMLLADEPTGNLDAETGGRILDAITSLHERDKRTLVMVTHDPSVAERADRIVRLRDGRLVEEI